MPSVTASSASCSSEVGIAGEEGAAGGVDEQRGRDLGARVEQPPRHAHRVVDGQRVPRPDLLGEPEAQRPAAQLAQPLADDLAVERMRETDLGTGRWRLDHDHAALLRGDERVGRAQRDDLLDAQGLTEREHLQRRPLRLRHVGHALGDELHERAAHGRRARQPPQTGAEDEPTRVEGAEHELADVERVALAALPDPPQRPLLHRPAEGRLDELLDGRVVERIELHAQRARVLPERHDGVRARLARADRRDDERAPRDRQVQHERRGHGVEQLRVVDADDDLAPVRPLGQRLDAAAHQGECVARPDAVGHDPGERSERDRRGALRGLHPVDERAVLRGDARGLTREARLPDPGTPTQHEPATAAVGASQHDPLQLLDAADERPRRARREHPGWRRGFQHATPRRVYVRVSCQRATLTGKVATQIAAPRNTTQASATSASCARRDGSRMLRPAKNSVRANSTTHNV